MESSHLAMAGKSANKTNVQTSLLAFLERGGGSFLEISSGAETPE